MSQNLKKRRRRFTDIDKHYSPLIEATDSDSDSSNIITNSEIAKMNTDNQVLLTLADTDVNRIAEAVKVSLKSEIVTEITSTVKNVFTEFVNEMKFEIAVLKQENTALKNENQELKLSIDELEQYGRRNAVRISGIPETPQEDTDAIVRDVASKMGVTINEEDISRSHRSGQPGKSYPRQILVKFTRYNTKRKLLKSRREMKSVTTLKHVYINEDLTKRRQALYKKTRELLKQGKINKSWTWDGKIFLTDKSNKKKTRIDRQSDLDPFIGTLSQQTSMEFQQANPISSTQARTYASAVSTT